MSSVALWDIPSWWEWKTIGDLGDVVSGGTPSSKEPTYWGDEINWISPADLTGYTDKKISKGSKSLTQKGLEKSSAKLMPKGSVHFSSRAPIGYVVISEEDMSTNQGLKSLIPKDGVFNEYVYYYLKGSKQLAEKHASGTTFLELSGKAFCGLPIPLPPEKEQKDIVAKIETLFSKLDKGIESLKVARQQLKAYRQVVLKHAFKGKLTKHWRQQNFDKLENPEQLLTCIQQEREQRYQKQLEEWKQAVKTWKDGGKKGKQPSRQRRAKDDLEAFVREIDVPSEWGCTIIGMLNVEIFDGPFGSNLKGSDYVDRGVRVIRLENIGHMKFIEENYSYVSEEKYEQIKKHTVSSGDIIFSSFITEGKGIRVVILPEKMDRAINKADCFCVRNHGELYSTEFLAWYLSSRAAYKQVESEIHGIGRPRINTTQLKRFAVPLCSIDEQNEVICTIKEMLSKADYMDEVLDSEIQRVEALRQLILRKAFSGELVSNENQSDRAARTELDDEVPFPFILPGIAEKDLQAGIIAMAYRMHGTSSYGLENFGHIKAEKISHLVEYHLGLSLGRQPVKDAAGPNDYPHLKKVEHRARKANWFDVEQTETGKYDFSPKPGFDRLLEKVSQALGDRLAEVEELIYLMLPMTMRQSEIFATVYAAWNNLLLLGEVPSDEQIVMEARENWHESKLKIEREKFFLALSWMRKKDIVPSGRGRVVKEKGLKTA